MKAPPVKFFAVLLTALALIGCDQGHKAPPKTNVRVVNVAPSYAALGFRREQTDAIDSLAFKGAASHEYDEDTYDFFVFQRTLTTQQQPSWTFSKKIVADKNYAFVLAEAAGQVSPQIIEYTPKLANSGDVQIAVIHAGETLPPMDVYLEHTGVGIAGATPRGSLAFLGQVPPTTLASGDYELTLTAAGDPSNVLFTSTSLTLGAGGTNVFVITAEGGQGTETISVVVSQDSPLVLYSTNATAGLRVINAANDAQPRDFAVNHEFSPPLFSAVPYATATNYVSAPINASLPISVTPVGNPGVLEVDGITVTSAGQLNTAIFGGPTGALTYQVVNDDRRRITNEAKLRYFNASTQFTTAMDLVLLPPNTADQTTVAATTVVTAFGTSEYLYVPPGSYDLLLREDGTNTVRAGPIPVTLVSGGIYGILSLNGPDTATASVVFLDDQP